MHVHLPKPLHGWREFVGEVGIIVVGVLIALTAEQIIKHFDDRTLAREARENVQAELSANLGKMQSRDRIERCIQDRLNAIGAYLDVKQNGAQTPPPSWIGRPQFWIMDTAAFDSAGSSARLALLPTSEQMDYDEAYSSMRNFEQTEQNEQASWAQLRGLAGQQNITPAQDADLRHALQSARYDAWILHVNSVQAQHRLDAYRVHPAAQRNGSKSVCIPVNTSFDEAVRESGSADIGEPR